MAEITLERLNAFVVKYGDLKIIDKDGTTKILSNGNPDVSDLMEKATHFRYDHKWYTRDEFGTILEKAGV